MKHDIHVRVGKRRKAPASNSSSIELRRAKVSGILIIGYGSALRGDDAIGLHAARELENQFHRDSDVEVVSCHQLTPELADDISRSELVIFLDASCSGKPGTLQCKPISLHTCPGAFTHQLDPASLVAAAEQLYGEAPKAISITLTGWSFEMGSKLSRGAQLQLPELIQRTREVVASHRKQFAGAAAPSRAF